MFDKAKNLSGLNTWFNSLASTQPPATPLPTTPPLATPTPLSTLPPTPIETPPTTVSPSTPIPVGIPKTGFVSFLKHIGTDLEHGAELLAPIVRELSCIFPPPINTCIQLTTNAIMLAEQSGQTNEQKLEAVYNLTAPIIIQALRVVCKDTNEAKVKEFINVLVYLLNMKPAPVVRP